MKDVLQLHVPQIAWAGCTVLQLHVAQIPCGQVPVVAWTDVLSDPAFESEEVAKNEALWINCRSIFLDQGGGPQLSQERTDAGTQAMPQQIYRETKPQKNSPRRRYVYPRYEQRAFARAFWSTHGCWRVPSRY
jgi:hypothetical protein